MKELLENKLKEIDQLIMKSEKSSEYMPEARKVLISPHILSDDQYVKMWEGVAYKGKEISDDVPSIVTERGEFETYKKTVDMRVVEQMLKTFIQ